MPAYSVNPALAARFFLPFGLIILALTMPPVAPARAQKAMAKFETQIKTEEQNERPGPVLTGYAALYAPGSSAQHAPVLASWQRVLEAHKPDAAFGKGQNNLPSHHLKQWQNLAAMMPQLQPIKQLQYINGFFNFFPSQQDQSTYCREEYWATPEEFMAKGGGDCEDYAIAKYLALRHFGWKAEDMWLLIVRHRKKNERHAVLVVRENKRLLVLDNLSRPVQQLVPEQIFLSNFVPLYALNELGFWYIAGTMSAQ